MSTDTGEKAADLANRITQSLYENINPRTVDSLQNEADDFATAMGESSEAWRGALGMLGMIGTMLSELPTDLEEARSSIAMMHAFVVLVVASPAAQVALRTKEVV